MKNKHSWLLIIPVIFGLTACASMPSRLTEPPLPNDLNIISPSPDLPKNIAVFSGKWKGTWNYGMDSILVVEEIQETRGKIVWAWGDAVDFYIFPGYYRFEVEVISSPKPKIQWFPPYGPRVNSFEVIDSNTLYGITSFRGGWGSTTIIMTRTD